MSLSTASSTGITGCAAQAVFDVCYTTTSSYLGLCSQNDFACLCDRCFDVCPDDERASANKGTKDMYCQNASIYNSLSATATPATTTMTTTTMTTTTAASGDSTAVSSVTTTTRETAETSTLAVSSTVTGKTTQVSDISPETSETAAATTATQGSNGAAPNRAANAGGLLAVMAGIAAAIL